MGLTSTFTIGRSALTASQLGLQVAGNNLANAATPGYTRQTLGLTPAYSQRTGNNFTGLGVRVAGIRREIDESVLQRLRLGVADEAAAVAKLETLSSVETTLGELTGNSVTSNLNTFFSAWSERANLVASDTVVIQEGAALAAKLSETRARLSQQQSQIDNEIEASIARADSLLNELASINAAVVNATDGRGEDGNLRDRRDQLLTELSELLDITVNELPGGGMDVLVGSTPVLLGGRNLGLDLERTTNGSGGFDVSVALEDNGRNLSITGGRIGGLLESRQSAVGDTIEALDGIARELIRQVNRIHATGAGDTGLKFAAGTAALSATNRALALNDPSFVAGGALPFEIENGGFEVRVTNPETGAETLTRIDVDLDGIDNTGTAGFDDDTSAEDIRAALDAIDGLSATFTPDGKLQITAAPGREFGFEDDTSGVLGALGVNAFFVGEDAADIAINQDLEANPGRLRVGRYTEGEFSSNGTALALADLREVALDQLGGRNIVERWSASAQAVGNRTSAAITETEAASLVRQSLEAERAALSGVSTDEESINLLEYQRQYEAAARLIAVTDELLQTLLSLV